jgi:NDP-sugar pyrophosphorylase family protein
VTSFAAVVLAAGAGTRLRPLTDLRPKALCPVANVPLVDLAIAHVEEDAAAVAVNVHFHREQMEQHFAGREDVHLSIEHGEALGTAGALGQLRDWIDGRPTLLHNADAWHDADLHRHLAEGWDGERIRLLVVPTDGGRGDFGPWRYAGAALLPWRDVAPLAPEPTGLYVVSWRQAARDGRIDLAPHDGAWFDTGTPRTYLAANLAASRGASVVGRTAVVEDGAELVRSVVWDDAVVRRGERLVEQIRAPGDVTVHAPL